MCGESGGLAGQTATKADHSGKSKKEKKLSIIIKLNIYKM
jgi:hypothetical protein